MKTIRLSVKANLYKMCHSKLIWIHILLPILAATVFNLYFVASGKSKPESVELYLQAIALLFPMMISIVTTMVYEADLSAGKFQLFHMLTDKKYLGHIGNLLALLFLGMAASVLSVAGFGLLFKEMNSFFYIRATGILFCVNLIGYIIQYMVCYTLGRGVSLGLGVVGLLLGPLMYLVMGDFVWKYIPCSYGIRMISYYCIINIGDANSYLMDYAANELIMGALVITVITILAVVLFCIWGNSWEGFGTNGE